MPKQINEYIYSTKLENFNIEGTPGEEYYEDKDVYKRQFQYRMKMNANGIADDETLDAIYAPDAMVRDD